MNTFDIIIAALLIFGFVRGLLKGLFVEVASLVALIAGVYGAIHFSYFVGNFWGDLIAYAPLTLVIIATIITLYSGTMYILVNKNIFKSLKSLLLVFIFLNNKV